MSKYREFRVWCSLGEDASDATTIMAESAKAAAEQWARASGDCAIVKVVDPSIPHEQTLAVSRKVVRTFEARPFPSEPEPEQTYRHEE